MGIDERDSIYALYLEADWKQRGRSGASESNHVVNQDVANEQSILSGSQERQVLCPQFSPSIISFWPLFMSFLC